MNNKKLSFTIRNPMPPLWLMYPNISQFSIGWRMGYGEKYKFDFFDWIKTLTTEELHQYKILFPVPKRWQGFWNDDLQEWQSSLYKRNKYWTYIWQHNGMPEYSLIQLRQDYNSGKITEWLPFWGHQPSVDGKIIHSCLSQWWQSDIYIDQTHYCCMEQYMMAEKAKLFEDEKTLKEILMCKDPKSIKALGRKVEPFEDDIWNQIKYSIVLNGNYLKFIQNQNLKAYLLGTGEKVIVETSPYDDVWGIKMSADDEGVENPLNWKGNNLLGFALMEVRNEIKRICQNESIIDWQKIRYIYDDSPL